MTNPDETNDRAADESGEFEEASSPHDALFYRTFSKPEQAAAELKCIMDPEFVAIADWASLTLLSGTFVDAKLKRKYSDVLYSIRIADVEMLVYVLLEHKSEPDRWTLLQTLEYMSRIWRTYLSEKTNKGKKYLPVILPVLLHHAESGWTSPRRFREYFEVPASLERFVSSYRLDFGVLLDDIGKENSATLLARPMPAEGKFVLYCLRYGRTPNELFGQLPNWKREFEAVQRGQQGELVTAGIIVYVMSAGKISEAEVRMRFEETLGTDLADEVMFAWERRYAKGVRDGELKGLRDGKLEGELEGKRGIVLELLEERFGAVPPAAHSRIQAATSNELKVMARLVLTAATLDEVLGKSTTRSS